jgi:hypothetical protein
MRLPALKCNFNGFSRIAAPFDQGKLNGYGGCRNDLLLGVNFHHTTG